MGQLTADTVFELITREIDRRLPARTSEILRGVIEGGGSVAAKDLAQISDTISATLALAVKPRIKSGLTVTATTPPSGSVTIALGTGYANGKSLALDENRTIPVPFDLKSEIIYVNLDVSNSLTLERTKFEDKLVVAKIIIPQPGITSIILDTKPTILDPIYGWIVSGKDAVFDADQEFDEDSIEALKDAIGTVLAETIIGTITLSEQVKVSSSLGTIEMDAEEIRIKYASGTIAAAFNKFGTFFYDEAGLERARFTATDAAIGNTVTITPDGLDIIGEAGLTVIRGGSISVDDGSGVSTIIDPTKIFIGQSETGQGIDLSNADGTQIFIDINGVDGQHIHPESIDATSIVAGTITADEIAAGTITADLISTKTITADKFESTLFGDLNQAIRYTKKALSANPEFEKLMTQADLDAGTSVQISTANTSLQLDTQDHWDSQAWDTGNWDIPVFASGNWTSAIIDITSSITGQLTVSAQIVEDNPASTTSIVYAQYSTDGVTFGANSPAFNDGLFETLVESASGGGSNFQGSIFAYRYFKVKVELSTLDTTKNIILSLVTLKVDQVNIIGFKDRLQIASGGTSFTYSGFGLVPAIVPSIQGNYIGIPVVTTKSTTSATIKVFSGSTFIDAGGTVDVAIIGA